jgi:hypothetical protein
VVFEPVFRRYADLYRETGTFNASELCHACEEESARHLGEEPARVRMILDALAQSPQLASLDSLPAMAPAPHASAVQSLDGVPGNSGRQEALNATGQAGNTALAVPPVLRRLNASFDRFAELAAKQGLEVRARSLLALVSARLDADVRSQLSQPPILGEGHAQERIILDGEFLDWLLDGRDRAAGAFWEIAAMVRELRIGSQ